MEQHGGFTLSLSLPLQDSKQQQNFYLGSVPVNARTDWSCLDSLIVKTFKVSECLSSLTVST